jgi:hypothetical protein
MSPFLFQQSAGNNDWTFCDAMTTRQNLRRFAAALTSGRARLAERVTRG